MYERVEFGHDAVERTRGRMNSLRSGGDTIEGSDVGMEMGLR